MEATYSPSIDASLGLIYRLNLLWPKADNAAQDGRYDDWNNVLDRIYSSLDYDPSKIVVVKTEDGKINDIKIDDDDAVIYKFLSAKVFSARTELFKCKKGQLNEDGISPIVIAKNNWYQALMKKDRWIRKLMQKKKLYLKVNEQSPGTALFGSFGNKKRFR